MSGFGAGSGIGSAISSIVSNLGSNSGGNSGMAFDWSQLPHVIHEGINTTLNVAGFLNGISHSSSQSPTWGDLLKSAKVQDLYNARAEARALSNSKELFRFQNIAGPQFSVEGYKRAGLNPALVANFGGGSASPISASTVHPSADVVPKVDKASRFFNLAQNLQSLRESESRVEANYASAKNLFSRTETEEALRQFKQSLTYYKAINESQAPLKLKSFLKGQAVQNVLNAARILTLNSQQAVNAKETQVLDARKKYYEALSKRDRIGYNNTYINFDTRALFNWLKNASNPLGGFIERGLEGGSFGGSSWNN